MGTQTSSVERPSAMETGGLDCLGSMPGARSQGGGGMGQGLAREGTVVLLIGGEVLTSLCSAADLWCDHKVGGQRLRMGARVQE